VFSNVGDEQNALYFNILAVVLQKMAQLPNTKIMLFSNMGAE